MVRKEDRWEWTDEEKLKISTSRKKYLIENKDKHPWSRNSKFKSVPCEKVKEYLDNNDIKFIEEYKPLFPRRHFSIDIAFPHLKVGIEINGNQHYNRDGSLKDYYQERHDLIENDGWRLYEFHYSSVYNGLIYDSLEKIFSRGKFKIDFDKEFWLDKNKRNTKRWREDQEILARRKERIEKINHIKDLLIHSSIDFQKFGWVGKAAKIIGVKDQVVNRWMKRNMPEFYKECYVRKKAR